MDKIEKHSQSLIYSSIRDPIHGKIGLEPMLAKLVMTPEFQRLRRIKQLSFGQICFPSANHTRYEHSLGTHHLCKRITNTLEIENNDKIDVHIAALLHDIGHSAFSHSVEEIIKHHSTWFPKKIDHEIITAKVITENSKVSDVLERNGFSLKRRKRIASIATNIKNGLKDRELFLSDIITGEFGCDRIDYLLRDSHHAGLPYGLVEVHNLIDYLSKVDLEGQIRLSVKYEFSRAGLDAVSYLLIARKHHFASIVRQPRIRMANLMFDRALEKFLLKKNDEEKFLFVSKLFRQYDDESLMAILTSSESSKESKRLILDLKNGKIIGDAPETRLYVYLDDLVPHYRYYLLIINNDSVKRTVFLSHIKNKALNKGKENVKDPVEILTDLDVPRYGDIPVEMFLDIKEESIVRSLFTFDKSRLILDLAISAGCAGCLAIYSEKKIPSNFELQKFVVFARQIVQSMRESCLIPTDLILLAIETGSRIYDIDEHNMDFRGVPTLQRLMKLIKIGQKGNKTAIYSLQPIATNPELLYNRKLYQDLFLLTGMGLVSITRKPLGFGKDKVPQKNLYENENKILTVLSRLDFALTKNGQNVVKEIYEQINKSKAYENCIKRLQTYICE